MFSSNLLKVFELLLFQIIEEKCNVDPTQFGFRKCTVCTNALMGVKKTNLSYNVLGAFIHLSKAFGRINTNILISKERKVCINVIEKGVCPRQSLMVCIYKKKYF